MKTKEVKKKSVHRSAYSKTQNSGAKKIKAKVSKKVTKKTVKKKTIAKKSTKKNTTKRKVLKTKNSKSKVRKSKATKKPKSMSKTRPKKLERAATGISKFDKMTKGGFEKSSLNLITGGIGSAKTIFCMQFLIEGIKKREKVLYVTFEEKKEEFFGNMKTFGWDLEKEEKKGNFIFLEYSPEKVKMMLDEGGGSIETLVLRHGIKRMVFDSITSFLLLFEKDLAKRQAVLGLFDIMRKWNCTILSTVQKNPSVERTGDISSVELEADSITQVYFVSVKSQRKRYIEVIKMRGTNHSREIYSFEVGKKGIKIGNKIKDRKILN